MAGDLRTNDISDRKARRVTSARWYTHLSQWNPVGSSLRVVHPRYWNMAVRKANAPLGFGKEAKQLRPGFYAFQSNWQARSQAGPLLLEETFSKVSNSQVVEWYWVFWDQQASNNKETELRRQFGEFFAVFSLSSLVPMGFSAALLFLFFLFFLVFYFFLCNLVFFGGWGVLENLIDIRMDC